VRLEGRSEGDWKLGRSSEILARSSALREAQRRRLPRSFAPERPISRGPSHIRAASPSTSTGCSYLLRLCYRCCSLPCCFCCPAALPLLLLELVTLLISSFAYQPSHRKTPSIVVSRLHSQTSTSPSSLSSSFLPLETQQPRPRLNTLERHRPLLSTPFPTTRPILEDESAITHPAVRHAPHCTASTRPRCLCFGPAQNYDSSPAHVPPSHTTQLSCHQRANPSKLRGEINSCASVQYNCHCWAKGPEAAAPPFICERTSTPPSPAIAKHTHCPICANTNFHIPIPFRSVQSFSPRRQRHNDTAESVL
jgi:hypothetical protein